MESSEPGSLDPSHADDPEEIIVIRQLFKGLIDYDPRTAEIRPASAKTWEVSPDAKTFTFTLREDNRFSNGEPVKADNFVRGFTRATAKAERSEIAHHLSSIVGYKEHHDDGTAPDLRGVRALDESRLEVELSAPDADFLTKVGHTVFVPMPSDETMANQKPTWAEFPIGNGPFLMREAWKHNQSITLVPNRSYYGAKPFLEEVSFVLLTDLETAYEEWQAGNLDWTRIPPTKLKDAQTQYPASFLKKPTKGLNYLVTTTNAAPTNSVLFRRAVSLAIDRRSISGSVFGGLYPPATGILPPVMPGYRKPNDKGIGPCGFCTYDPGRARTLLAQSKVDLRGKLTIGFVGGRGVEQWIRPLANQLKKNLGIETQLVPTRPLSDYLAFLGRTASGVLGDLSWDMDYPTADNFLSPLFGSGSDGNYSRFSSRALDELIRRARSERDPAKRLAIYQEAEDLVLAELPIIPLWWRTQFRLINTSKFGRLDMDPFEHPTLETAFVKTKAEG